MLWFPERVSYGLMQLVRWWCTGVIFVGMGYEYLLDGFTGALGCLVDGVRDLARCFLSVLRALFSYSVDAFMLLIEIIAFIMSTFMLCIILPPAAIYYFFIDDGRWKFTLAIIVPTLVVWQFTNMYYALIVLIGLPCLLFTTLMTVMAAA
jgi:hypothetical protein